MKDAGLKELLFKHYWAQGCFAQPEVDIHFQEGLHGSTKLITDVDVYALRPHANLHYERILGDCRTLKGMSPINRSLWLKGLMSYVDATSGCVLLNANTQIERDHKLAASHLGIVILNESEFKIYDRSIIYPNGSERVTVSTKDINYLKALPSRFPKLERLTTFLYRDAWREAHAYRLIRHGLSAIIGVSGELDPAKREHIALLCDATAIFGIGVAECAGSIFHQYLHPDDKNSLSESLKVLIWGGSETYNYYQAIRRRLIQAKFGGDVDEQLSLELPEWNAFVQIIRNMLDNPSAALQVPRIMRQMASDILNDDTVLVDATPQDLMALKMSMLLASYVCKAARLPREFDSLIVSNLVAIQSELTVANSQTQVKHSESKTAGEQIDLTGHE